MAALAQDYRQPEPFEVPEGGLASFLTATTGEWAEASNDDHIPETGIAGVKAVADKLAEYGRYEDEYMVHAAEGETVIPAQVLDLNPRLKAKLFKEMRDMGLEPERYVVGNELNSINPVTGQPEFFLKKLFKGIKGCKKGRKGTEESGNCGFAYRFIVHASRTNLRCCCRLWLRNFNSRWQLKRRLKERLN